MKPIAHFVISAGLLLFALGGCRKAPLIPQEHDLVQSAKSYFESEIQSSRPDLTGNSRTKARKYPYWKEAYVLSTSHGDAVVVPVFYRENLVVKTNLASTTLIPLNYLTKLVMFKTEAGFFTELLTYFPDSLGLMFAGGKPSGIVFNEGWDGTLFKRYRVTDGVILTETAPSQQDGDSKSITSNGGKEGAMLISQCTTIYGYNYSSGGSDDLYFWSESGGCTYTYIPDPPVNQGLAPVDLSTLFSRPPVPPFVTIAPPTNVIGNIQNYIQCFSNYAGSDHGYQVMVCVDQPEPGSRDAWALTSSGVAGSSAGANPVDAGHVFLVLTENFGGYSIVRNVGFYPQTNVFPWSSSAQGQLNNDDGHAYNISLTINVDNAQFFNILNYISQGNNPGYMYDLNTNNCTSFVIHALEAGNVNLPATVGSWSDGGFGYDPGDLGEDIRTMPLLSNMTRNTTYNDHPNKYTCN